MPGTIPNTVILYRIVHIDNVDFLLTNGIFTKNHRNRDPNYINIGDNTLIEQRDDYPVGITPPGGTLGEYIPFYFGPLSPMLLNIKTGHRGIRQRPQSDIVYICCKLDDVIANCTEWCFTNGHAKTLITEFYNKIKFLDKIDWDLVGARYWLNNEDDYGRMRKKQAEFLVKEKVPVVCINSIVVFDDKKRIFIESIIKRLGLNIPVNVNPGNKYYY